jgi:spermidine/putrescine transport system ATP-binding protein
MSDRIAVMHDGVIEQLDVPAEIYEHPKTKFVAGFIGESNIFDGKVTSVSGDLLTVETEAGTLQVKGEGFAQGEEMHVAIRPEYMQVSRTATEGFCLPGRIKDFIYQGTVVKTALDLENGQEVKYSRFEQDQSVSEGDQVYIYWKPEKAVAIKKMDQGA